MNDDTQKALEQQRQGIEIALKPILEQQQRELKFKKWRLALTLFIIVMAVGMNIWFRMDFFGDSKPDNDYVSLVRIEGEIVPGGASADKVVPLIEKAFKDKDAKGVVLLVNSPGGTPVQAGIIHDRLLTLRKEYPDKKLIAVGEDMVTSGAYMVSLGAPKIYAHESSMVGSIGVIMRSFGYVDIANKLGIERRVIHAGKNKNSMDSFMPLSDEDKAKAEKKLDRIHQQFIAKVKASRGDRLKDSPDTFTGAYWTGDVALNMGLIDGLGSMPEIVKAEFGVEDYKEYRHGKSLLGHIMGAMAQTAASVFAKESGPNMKPSLLTH